MSQSRLDIVSNSLSLALRNLKEAHDKRDNSLFRQHLADLVPLFRDVGAVRCQLTCERALEVY